MKRRNLGSLSCPDLCYSTEMEPHLEFMAQEELLRALQVIYTWKESPVLFPVRRWCGNEQIFPVRSEKGC